MNDFYLDTALADAASACDYARAVRAHHRRRHRRGHPQREADIRIALDRLKRGMRAIRAARAEADGYPAVLRSASRAIQRERMKLHKMKENTSEQD